MLGEILTQITQPNSQGKSMVDTLVEQNQQIAEELRVIEEELTNLPLNEMMNYIEDHSDSVRANPLKSSNIENIFAIIEQFHHLSSKSQLQSKRCEFLLEEMKIIVELVEHYDLFQTIELRRQVSSEMNLKYLKDLEETIAQQTLEYQDQQNINRFQAEHQEACQEYANVLAFYKKMKELVVSAHEEIVRSNYECKDGGLRIKVEYFSAIWTEFPHIQTDFINSLTRFFQQFISYDINDRQYSLTVFTLAITGQQIEVKQHSKIIFDSNQVSLHYDALINNLNLVHSFFHQLIGITPNPKQNLVNSSKKQILDNIKSYVEYLLPYLSMQHRRKVLSFFTAAEESQDIYDLLVSLRMCGKDADMLVKNIKQIVAKISQDSSYLTTVLRFLEVAKENKKNHHMNFFICNQLVEELEEGEISTEVVDAIKRLLLIREEMRMKIHSFVEKQ